MTSRSSRCLRAISFWEYRGYPLADSTSSVSMLTRSPGSVLPPCDPEVCPRLDPSDRGLQLRGWRVHVELEVHYPQKAGEEVPHRYRDRQLNDLRVPEMLLHPRDGLLRHAQRLLMEAHLVGAGGQLIREVEGCQLGLAEAVAVPAEIAQGDKVLFGDAVLLRRVQPVAQGVPGVVQDRDPNRAQLLGPLVEGSGGEDGLQEGEISLEDARIVGDHPPGVEDLSVLLFARVERGLGLGRNLVSVDHPHERHAVPLSSVVRGRPGPRTALTPWSCGRFRPPGPPTARPHPPGRRFGGAGCGGW